MIQTCVICGEESDSEVCDECRANPWWDGMSTEDLIAFMAECDAVTEIGRRRIAQGFAPIDHVPAKPGAN